MSAALPLYRVLSIIRYITFTTRPHPWSLFRPVAIKALPPPAMVLLLHMILFAVGLYRTIPGLDMATHSLGGIAITYCFWQVVAILRQHAFVEPVEAPVAPILLFALATTSAVLWEFAEFTLDSYLGTHIQIDLTDTMSDLAFGMLGSLIVLLVIKTQTRTTRAG